MTSFSCCDEKDRIRGCECSVTSHLERKLPPSLTHTRRSRPWQESVLHILQHSSFFGHLLVILHFTSPKPFSPNFQTACETILSFCKAFLSYFLNKIFLYDLFSAMLLERFTLLGLVLAPSTAALAISTSFSTPTTTLPNTATASPEASTNSVYFLTTKYITIPVVTNAHVTIPAKTIDIAIPTCIHTITPDKNGYVPPGTCGALYDYYPSFTAAIVVAALFGMLTVVHVTQAAVYKKVSSSLLDGWLDTIANLNGNTEVLLGHYHGKFVGVCIVRRSIDINSQPTKCWG
jgi:hypothetical protein